MNNLNEEKMENSEQPIQAEVQNTEPVSPKKPGGWLLLLIFVLIIWNPCYKTFVFFAEFRSIQNIDPYLMLNPFYEYYQWIYKSIIIIGSLISVYAGYCLWKKLEWKSVKWGKMALWITGPISVVLHNSIYYGISTPSPSLYHFIGYILVVLFIPLIWAIIWTTYLSKSGRVQQTYLKKHSSENVS